MKINLKKLSKIEKEYSQSNITLSALNDMVRLATDYTVEITEATKSAAYLTALITLKELGILED